MAREPVIAMDFMGIGKSARDCQGSTQSDGATLVRPTPTLPSLKDRHNWHSSLPVPEGGARPSQLNQLRKILPQGASPAFGYPSLSFLKARGWLSSQAKEAVPTGGAQSKQYAFSEKPSLEKPLEELTDEESVQLTREECPRYLKERGMWCPSWNQSQALQQVLSVKGLFDSKSFGEKDCNKEEDASQNYSAHAAAKDHFLPSQGNPKYEPSQPAEAFASICHKGSDLLTNSELTLSLASAWDKEPRVPQLGVFDSSLSALSASSRGFPLLALDVDQHTMESTVLPLLNDSDPRVSSRPPTAQLTIFYSGLVNVYDNVPAGKAQAIMLLADSGSSRTSLLNAPVVGDLLSVPVVEKAPAPSADSPMADQSQDLAPPNLPATVSPTVTQQAVRRAHTELPQARKASLQRFLEKRKERARARAPYAEKNPESDGSLPWENCSEKFPNPGTTLEAWSDSTAPQPPLSPSPAITDKGLHPACKPSSPSKALGVTQPSSLNEQERKEATGLALGKEIG